MKLLFILFSFLILSGFGFGNNDLQESKFNTWDESYPRGFDEKLTAFRIKAPPFIYSRVPGILDRFYNTGYENTRREVAQSLVGQAVFIDTADQARRYGKLTIAFSIQWGGLLAADSSYNESFFNVRDLVQNDPAIALNSPFSQVEEQGGDQPVYRYDRIVNLLIDDDAVERLKEVTCSKRGFCVGELAYRRPLMVPKRDEQTGEYDLVEFNPLTDMPSGVLVEGDGRGADYGTAEKVTAIFIASDGEEFIPTYDGHLNPASNFLPP